MSTRDGVVGTVQDSTCWLSSLERPVAEAIIRGMPRCIQSHHLTLVTVLWTALALSSGMLARMNKGWLWALSGVICLQYLTDAIDGKLGKRRGEGLVEWGYYMDHFLDYVFLCALLIVYTWLLPMRFQYLMVPVMALCGAFMVSAFLAKPGTGKLRVSFLKFGAVEVRLIFVLLNSWLAISGDIAALAVVPYVLAAVAGVLALLVYQTQRQLWNIDRANVRRIRYLDASSALHREAESRRGPAAAKIER